MNREAMREALLPHAKRPIRAFLRRPDEAAEGALWDLVYDRAPCVTFGVAKAVETELEHSPVTVGELLSGWRPAALTEEERH